MNTLWSIESGLADLMEQRQNATDEQRVDIDLAIVEHVKAEVRKVDGIRAMAKHLEMIRDAAWAEADAMKNRAQRAEQQLQVLKSAVQVTMEEMEWRQGKPRKLEGKTGAISLKGNGGRQPVVITDESMIPDEYRTVTLKMNGALWRRICATVTELSGLQFVSKEPNLSLIGAALQVDEGVPGAVLAPRGQHVEIV